MNVDDMGVDDIFSTITNINRVLQCLLKSVEVLKGFGSNNSFQSNLAFSAS